MNKIAHATPLDFTIAPAPLWRGVGFLFRSVRMFSQGGLYAARHLERPQSDAISR